MDIESIKKILPEVPDIIGREFALSTAVLIPLIKIDGEFHILFEERNANIRQGSEICFPGGKVDNSIDCTFLDSAVRETVEELGIDRENIEVIGCFNTLTSHMGVIVNTFIAEIKVSSINDLKLAPNEVARVFTLPVSYFKENPPQIYKIRIEAKPSYIDEDGNEIVTFPCKELGLPERYLKPWGNNNHRVVVYQTGKGVIWGMTAKVVLELVNLL